MHKRIGIVFVAIILVLFNPNPITAQESEITTEFIPQTLYNSIDLIQNNDFTDPIECGVNGSSGEFSYKQDTDLGIVTLNWSHLSGTPLEYDNNSIVIPRCKEFAYLTQRFSWDYEVLPTILELTLRYNITTEGDFQFDNWPGMYEIWTWLIDPNGDWYEIETLYGGIDDFFTRTIRIEGEASEFVFNSLIEADQQSNAKIAVCLVPSWRFLEFNGASPWEEYNGSVLISFQYLRMSSIYRTTNDFPQEKEPLYETEWRQGDSDFYRDSCLTSDGKSLLLSSYEIDNEIVGSSLTLLDSHAEVIWRRTWNESDAIFWHDVGFYSDRIYLLGSIDSSEGGNDIQLRALDWQGDYLWEKNYDFAFSENLRDMAISRDGDIYIGFYVSENLNKNHLLRLDSNGNIVWDREFDTDQWQNILKIDVGIDGSIFTLTFFELRKWTKQGEKIWNVLDDFDDFCILSDGTVFTVQESNYGAYLNISKLSQDGIPVWSESLSIQYTEEWYEYIGVNSITQAYDGNIFLLLALRGYHPGRIIFQFDSNGNQLGNTTVIFSEVQYYAFNKPQYLDMRIGDNNLVFLYGRILDREWDYTLSVAIHNFSPLIIGTTGRAIIATIVATSILVLTIFILHRLKHE